MSTSSPRSAGDTPAAGSSNRTKRGAAARARREMHRFDKVIGRLHQRVVDARPKRREAAARDAAAGKVDVVVNGEPGEQSGNLVGAAQAAADAFERREVGDVLAEETDGAGGRRKIPGDAVE